MAYFSPVRGETSFSTATLASVLRVCTLRVAFRESVVSSWAGLRHQISGVQSNAIPVDGISRHAIKIDVLILVFEDA
jgi:hypothetical protein